MGVKARGQGVGRAGLRRRGRGLVGAPPATPSTTPASAATSTVGRGRRREVGLVQGGQLGGDDGDGA